MWERYRGQIMDGRHRDLRDLLDSLTTKRSEYEEALPYAREEKHGIKWGIILLQDLRKLHPENTTGAELVQVYPPGQHEELREDWVVTHFGSRWQDEPIGSGVVDLISFHLSPPQDVQYAGDLSKAHVSLSSKESIAEAHEKKLREYQRVEGRIRELSARSDELQRHAELIGVVLEEYELEGEVLPWFIGRNGHGRPEAAEPHTDREKQAARAAWAIIDYRDAHGGKSPYEDSPDFGGSKDEFYRYVGRNCGAERRGGKDGGKRLGLKVLKAVDLWERGTKGKSEGLMELVERLEEYGRARGRIYEK